MRSAGVRDPRFASGREETRHRGGESGRKRRLVQHVRGDNPVEPPPPQRLPPVADDELDRAEPEHHGTRVDPRPRALVAVEQDHLGVPARGGEPDDPGAAAEVEDRDPLEGRAAEQVASEGLSGRPEAGEVRQALLPRVRVGGEGFEQGIGVGVDVHPERRVRGRRKGAPDPPAAVRCGAERRGHRRGRLDHGRRLLSIARKRYHNARPPLRRRQPSYANDTPDGALGGGAPRKRMAWLIVDGHQDIAMALLEDPGRDFAAPAPAGRALSLADARRGGLAVILATIFAPQGRGSSGNPTEEAERQLRWYDDLLLRHEEHVFRLESRGDLTLCAPGGPIGIVHLMEGADPIRSVRDVARWVERGVRVIGPAWNTPNRWCGGVDDGRGLSADGMALIEEMGRLGVVPDVSHLTPAAFDSVLEAHRGVVVASHSNAAAIHPHRRNLSDAQIRAIADRGGLVGIVLYRPFLGDGRVTLDTVHRHIDHIVGLVGPDHLGIGSDLDGGFTTDDAPDGIRSVADLPRIGDMLLESGYSEDAVAKILGRSWLRVLEHALPA